MARYLLITAVGQDRPGLVAGVTEALLHSGCNVEDSTSTRLRNDFAMMFLVRHPEGAAASVRERLDAAAERMGLTITARELSDEEVRAQPEIGDTFHINVYGADRAGIVHAISACLAERGANIIDLRTSVAGTLERPIYVMLIEAGATPNEDPGAFAAAVTQVGAEMGVDVTVQRLEQVTL